MNLRIVLLSLLIGGIALLGDGEVSVAEESAAPQLEPGPAGALLIDRSDLAALPTSGPAWEYLRQQAGRASGVGHLSNYDDRDPYLRVATKHLAAALDYARTGNQASRAVVVRALNGLPGTEDRASTVGTSSSDRLLATVRQLPAWIMAADLVGHRPPAFAQWLRGMLGKTIGSHGRWRTIAGCAETSGNNWGAACMTSWIAVARFLGDEGEVARATLRFRAFLGERTVATPFVRTTDFDASYVCGGVDRWTPVNGTACGSAKDGLIVEDASRSASAFPALDSTGVNYVHEAFGSVVLSALLLRDYGSWAWSGQAVRRIAAALDRRQKINGNYSSTRWQAWVVNHAYGTAYPTVSAWMGRSLGFTDWLYR